MSGYAWLGPGIVDIPDGRTGTVVYLYGAFKLYCSKLKLILLKKTLVHVTEKMSDHSAI